MRERILRGIGFIAAVSISTAPGVETLTTQRTLAPHEVALPNETELYSRLPEGVRIDRDKNPKKIPCYTPPSQRRKK